MRHSRAKFDPTAEYVANKKLLLGGRTFQIGEKFDVHPTERQKRVLYEGRFLRFAPIEPAPYPEETSQPAADTQNESTGDADTSTEPVKEDIQKAPRERKIVPAGRGWHNVEDAEGNLVNTKKLRLKDAEKLLTQ